MRGNFTCHCVGYFVVLARSCLASKLHYIVMQMRKITVKSHLLE